MCSTILVSLFHWFRFSNGLPVLVPHNSSSFSNISKCRSIIIFLCISGSSKPSSSCLKCDVERRHAKGGRCHWKMANGIHWWLDWHMMGSNLRSRCDRELVFEGRCVGSELWRFLSEFYLCNEKNKKICVRDFVYLSHQETWTYKMI